MLETLRIKRFKSLADVEITLPRMAVLFGPNAAGKSNLLDAVQALSRIGTLRTVSDALAEPIRGYPVEAFSFPPGGLQELLGRSRSSFELATDVRAGRDSFRYRIEVAIEHYKQMLKAAVRQGGHPSTLGGLEFARELAAGMDLHRAGRRDHSLRAFIDDLRATLRRLRMR